MCVIDQAVAGTFPQIVLPGGQGPLVATHTGKIDWEWNHPQAGEVR